MCLNRKEEIPSPAFGVAFCCAQRVVPEKEKAKNKKNIEFIFHNYINYLLRKSIISLINKAKNTIIFPTFAALKTFFEIKH